MQELLKDLFIHRICIYFRKDGVTLSRLAATCRRFRDLILSIKEYERSIKYHSIWVSSPEEFMEAIGVKCVGSRAIIYDGLQYEGVRTFVCNMSFGEFNDYYNVSDQAEREIDRLEKRAYKYLLIRYAPLSGVGRWVLPNGLGTIHRGCSIVVYY